MKSTRGFTLIELLVVITIIVVLMALLAPALEKAVYQAELAQCAGKLHSTGAGIIQYAMNFGRHYPDRGLTALQDQQTAQYQYSFLTPTNLTEKVSTMWDMRPSIKPFIQINRQLQCPLVQQMELEIDQFPDESVSAPYTMWWGWRYDLTGNSRNPGDRGRIFGGMNRIGDRWEWQEGWVGAQLHRSNLLAGDFDLFLGDAANTGVQGTHPDRLSMMDLVAAKYQSLFGVGAGGTQAVPVTLSWWRRGLDAQRGLIDMNHLYDDLSIQRFTDVEDFSRAGGDKKSDDRMFGVPNQANNQQAGKRYQAPAN